MGFSAVIVAGGSGKRFSSLVPKQAVPMLGVKMWEWSAKAFDSSRGCEELIIVTPSLALGDLFSPSCSYSLPLIFTKGGSERHLSVLNGIRRASAPYVAVHDAARPFVKKELIEKLWEKCSKGFSVIPVTEVFDTIKVVEGGFISGTVDRTKLRRAQTPQFFSKEVILESLEKNPQGFTDDSSYLENTEYKIFAANGDPENIKITTQNDLIRANKILSSSIRIGFGIDYHRFAKNRDLVLGGVKIPFELGLLGHSDADVLLHAITDAILGACGMRDIGYYFPDTDKLFKGASSLDILGKAVEISGNPHIINLDSVVVAQKPRIGTYIDEMIEEISKVLSLEKNRISVKATTSEEMGPEGAMEGISARAVVSLLTI
ncbi:2-C-methyl-D-erythritol 2,4-cyclodiphosphate synthase [candidate division WOR-3 bacterium]|nr:2-C-methyl-D-erythritol 2,4-cyclodiphosphate synthase [candidate division WOR-3 bacterium]